MLRYGDLCVYLYANIEWHCVSLGSSSFREGHSEKMFQLVESADCISAQSVFSCLKQRDSVCSNKKDGGVRSQWTQWLITCHFQFVESENCVPAQWHDVSSATACFFSKMKAVVCAVPVMFSKGCQSTFRKVAPAAYACFFSKKKAVVCAVSVM